MAVSKLPRARWLWGAGAGVLALVLSLAFTTSTDGARISHALELAADAVSYTAEDPPSVRTARLQQAAETLLAPELEVSVGGETVAAGSDARARILSWAGALAQPGQHVELDLGRVHTRVRGRSASAEFDVVLRTDARGERREERRAVHAELVRGTERQWRLLRLELSRPDEAEPEARP